MTDSNATACARCGGPALVALIVCRACYEEHRREKLRAQADRQSWPADVLARALDHLLRKN